MIGKRTTSKGCAISRWLLNATLFISLLLSSEITQQPQHFQSYHTELSLPGRGASRTTIAYARSCFHTDVKEIDKSYSLNSFFHTQLYYALILRTKLKNARLIVPAVPIAVRYPHFQSTLSASDEDLSLSLRG